MKRASVWGFESSDSEFEEEIDEIKEKKRKEIEEFKKKGIVDIYAFESEEDKVKVEVREKKGDDEKKSWKKEQEKSERSSSESDSETDRRDRRSDRKDSKKKNKEKKDRKEKKEKKRDKKDKKDKKVKKDKKEKKEKRKDKKKEKENERDNERDSKKKAKKRERSIEKEEEEKESVIIRLPAVQPKPQIVEEESDESIIGPRAPRFNNDRADLEEDVSEEEQQIIRQTDPTYTPQQLQQYENLGYVMSRERNKKLKELKEKKEAKPPTLEEKKASIALSIAQKAEKEKQILVEMTQLLQSRLKVKKKE